MTTYQFDRDAVFDLGEREAICTWLAANDVDARLVPLDARLTIDGDRLTVQLHALNENGRRYIVADAVVRHTVDVILRQPLPEPPFRSLVETKERAA